MSKSRQQKVKNGKRRIERRLRRKNWSQQDEPMFKANNIHYELSERTRGIGVGGIGAVHKLALASGLVEAIDEKVDVLKVHLPYHESDHVLNIAYNILSGGTCLEDIELLRNDEVYLDGLGAQRIPDPTTAGRRDKSTSIELCASMVAKLECHLINTQGPVTDPLTEELWGYVSTVDVFCHTASDERIFC